MLSVNGVASGLRCATDAGDVLPHAPVVQGSGPALVHGIISRIDTSVHLFGRTSDGDAIHVEIKHARPRFEKKNDGCARWQPRDEEWAATSEKGQPRARLRCARHVTCPPRHRTLT